MPSWHRVWVPNSQFEDGVRDVNNIWLPKIISSCQLWGQGRSTFATLSTFKLFFRVLDFVRGNGVAQLSSFTTTEVLQDCLRGFNRVIFTTSSPLYQGYYHLKSQKDSSTGKYRSSSSKNHNLDFRGNKIFFWAFSNWLSI